MTTKTGKLVRFALLLIFLVGVEYLILESAQNVVVENLAWVDPKGPNLTKEQRESAIEREKRRKDYEDRIKIGHYLFAGFGLIAIIFTAKLIKYEFRQK